jgi:hypothetical protein
LIPSFLPSFPDALWQLIRTEHLQISNNKDKVAFWVRAD